LIKN